MQSQKFELHSGRHDHVPSGCVIAATSYVHETVSLPPYCVIGDHCYVGPHAILRPGAYLRDHSLVNARAVIGNSCEIKNSIVFEDVQIPHFNYVGDAVIGRGAHLGAGAILSNYRLDGKLITIRGYGEMVLNY